MSALAHAKLRQTRTAAYQGPCGIREFAPDGDLYGTAEVATASHPDLPHTANLERAAIGDAASRGWGTHLTTLSSVATQHQGDSLLRLAMHAPQPRSLIHAPIAGRS